MVKICRNVTCSILRDPLGPKIYRISQIEGHVSNDLLLYQRGALKSSGAGRPVTRSPSRRVGWLLLENCRKIIPTAQKVGQPIIFNEGTVQGVHI